MDKQERRERRRARWAERRRRNEPPRRSVLEEVGNSVSHGVGALLSVTALVLMLTHARTPMMTLSACLYGACMILMFLMSCLYHAWRAGSTVKRVWRRFDYCSIYLQIGGSFAPILLSYVGGTKGLVLFAVQWAIILTGITFIGVFGPASLRKMHIGLYVALGWSALLLLPDILRRDRALMMWLLAGGAAYTLGIIPFARKTRGAHFLWHLFVLAGAVLQFAGIYRYIFLA